MPRPRWRRSNVMPHYWRAPTSCQAELPEHNSLLPFHHDSGGIPQSLKTLSTACSNPRASSTAFLGRIHLTMTSRPSSSLNSTRVEPWANVHHSCELCLNVFFLDFSEDKKHPSGLPTNRWALIERRLGDEAPKFLERTKEGQTPEPFGLARTLTKEVIL